ncbi:MAG TPA: hypothetical protein VFQ77_05305 [Pseudonocardiaceae bacterium]|nr:hypothetical protein [Pseudonocardiaceae bacterium]
MFQRELERFAKPWYQVRSLRVFRDSTSLTANPGLWSSIEQALAESEWFVLMAAPEAARSSWINRELAWWLANRSVRRLLIVLTDGELAWDTRSGDFDRETTTALPPTLYGVLPEEPRWVDLRWLRAVEHVDRSNPRLQDCLADVVAALRGTSKDSLIGEHIKQHRRTIRLAQGGVTALALLLVAAMIAAVVAVVQRDNARNQARIATARQLAALALANLNTHLDLAQLLAVAAYRMDPSLQTRSTLLQAVAASPHLVRYLSAGVPVTVVTGSSDGSVVIAGTADGQVLRWETARDVPSVMRVSRAPITSVATDMHGTRILAADGHAAVLWEAVNGRQETIHAGQSALVAVAPSGKRLAVLDQAAEAAIPAQSDVGLTVYDGDSGQRVARTLLTSLWSKLGMPDDATVMLVGGAGQWERRSAASLATMVSSTNDLAPANAGTVGYSANAEYYGYDVFGQVSAWNTVAAAGSSRFDHPDRQTATNTKQEVKEAFTISRDGAWVATAAAGTVYVATTGDPGNKVLELTGNDGVNRNALAFLDDQRLVSATGSALTLWELSSPGRFGADLGVRLDYGCHACEPRFAPSPDGRWVAFVTVDQATQYRLDDPAHPPQVLTIPDLPGGNSFPGEQTLPVWSADSSRLVLLGLGNDSALVWDSSQPTRPVGRWPAAFSATHPVTARVSTDGTRVVVVNSHGDVVVRHVSDGAAERVSPGTSDLNTIGFPPPAAAATISYDLATAALVDQQGVTLVDIRTGQRRALPGGPGDGVLFTRDRLLVLRPTGALDVWDTSGTHLFMSVPGAGSYESVLAAPAQGDVVARLRSDGVVVLTQLDSGVTLGSFPVPTSPAGQTVMTFTADGDQLLVGAAGGPLTRWNMTETAWLRVACASAGRSLSPAEWRQYVHTPPPAKLACQQ